MTESSSFLTISLASGFSNAGTPNESLPDWLYEDDFKIVRHLDEHSRSEIQKQSRLKHAKFNTLAAALSLIACERLAVNGLTMESTGVLCTGGPLHSEVAWDFTERMLLRGPALLNPLPFPNTLVSSIPAAIAAALGAKAFAVSIGYDHHAFFDLLRRAVMLVTQRYSQRVVAIAAFDANALIRKASAITGLCDNAADTSVCGLLNPSSSGEPRLLVHEVLPVTRSFSALRGATDVPKENQFFVSFREGQVAEATFATALERSPVLTATGGVILMEAARSMWRRNECRPGQSFLVACEADGRASGLVLQWIN